MTALRIVTTTSDQMTSGGAGERLMERRGWIQVQLWVPAGERTEGMGLLVESVRSIFELQNIGAGDETVDVFAADRQTVGNDGRHYSTLVRAPYRVYETK